jgi:hypothetical protein
VMLSSFVIGVWQERVCGWCTKVCKCAVFVRECHEWGVNKSAHRALNGSAVCMSAKLTKTR